jgi:hypothetical protein
MQWRRVGELRYSSTILNLVTRWRWVIGFMPLPLYSWERDPGAHWIGGWVGHRVGLDTEEKAKISCPFQVSSFGPPLYQLSSCFEMPLFWSMAVPQCLKSCATEICSITAILTNTVTLITKYYNIRWRMVHFSRMTFPAENWFSSQL